jgi:hypothetical protein
MRWPMLVVIMNMAKKERFHSIQIPRSRVIFRQISVSNRINFGWSIMSDVRFWIFVMYVLREIK